MIKANLSKLPLLVFLSILTVSLTSAAITLDDNRESEQVEWFTPETSSLSDEDISGTATCEESGDLTLQKPSGSNKSLQTEDSGAFSHAMSDTSEYGTYTIVLNCTNSGSDEAELTFNFLDVETMYYSKDVIYHQDRQTVVFNLQFKGDENEFDPSQLELGQLSSDDTMIQDIMKETSKTGEVSYSFIVPDEEEPGQITPYWKLSYKDRFELSRWERKSFELKQPWNVNVNQDFLGKQSTLTKIERNNGDLMVINAKYRGDDFPLLPEDFKLEITDEDGNIVETRNSIPIEDVEGGTKLYLEDIPRLRLGSYTFEITITENEDYRLKKLPVMNYIDFQGKIKNADGNPVDGRFILERDGELKEFSTQSGVYSSKVLPGKYNMSIAFNDDVGLNVNQMRFENEGDRKIMYDRIPRKDLEGIEGVSVVKAIGLLFSYGFDGGEVTIGYDFGVEAEEVRIIKCDEWPMSPQRKCNGDWEVVNQSNVSIDPTVPKASFPVESETLQDKEFLMKGYALVKNTDLSLDADIREKRVPINGEMTFDGKIETPGGTAVQGVDVAVELLDGGKVIESANTRTNKNGAFGVNMQAQNKEGIYDVRIKAEKEPYNGFEATKSGVVDTFIEKDLTVEGPEQAEFRTGESTQVEYLIVNSGQADLKDIRFRIKNLNNEWYELSGDSWSKLKAGSSQTVTLNVTIPADYFDEQNLENEKFQAEARGVHSNGEVNSVVNTVGTITNKHQYDQTSTTSDSENRGTGSFSMNAPSIPSNITGNFLEDTSSFNVLLGMIIMFSLILAAAIKKSKQDDSRNDRMNRFGGGSGDLSSAAPKPSSNASRPQNISSDSERDISDTGTSAEDDDAIAEVAQALQEGDQEEEPESETEQSVQEEESDTGDKESESSDEQACSVCGEKFDSDSARRMHETAMH